MHKSIGKPFGAKNNLMFIVSQEAEKVKKNSGFSHCFQLDKDIKDRTYRGMLRTTYKLRNGKILYREEYHQGNYGAPGKKRQKKEKPTEEQVKVVNRMMKQRNCRLRLLEYFNEGDIHMDL